MKTFREHLLTEGFKKPKGAFPQSKKTYANSLKALKVGKELFAKFKDETLEHGDKVDVGTFAIARLVKKNKYIIVWVQNGDGTLSDMSWKFINAGHSATTKYLIDDHEKIGNEDWEVGGDYVIQWIY